MQLARAVLAATLANAACTDGVGTPIREQLERDDAAAPGAPNAGRWPRTCEDAAQASAALADSERELRDRINERRMAGVCDNWQFEPHPALRLSSELQCSARLHSADIAENDLWDEEDPERGSDGSRPSERMRAAGFELGASAESLVGEESDAMEALEDLIFRTNGCMNLSQGRFTHIGVGRYASYWTIDFAEYEPENGTAGP
jgi:uncharacterized protein YkwD